MTVATRHSDEARNPFKLTFSRSRRKHRAGAAYWSLARDLSRERESASPKLTALFRNDGSLRLSLGLTERTSDPSFRKSAVSFGLALSRTRLRNLASDQ